MTEDAKTDLNTYMLQEDGPIGCCALFQNYPYN